MLMEFLPPEVYTHLHMLTLIRWLAVMGARSTLLSQQHSLEVE